jgi:hypothetical protein
MPASTLARLVMALMATLAVGCKSSPRVADAATSGRVEALLSGYGDKDALIRFLGWPPEACLTSRPGFEVCGWRVERVHGSWRSLAGAIETRDRLSLICELPLAGSPRVAGSCTVHPRRSNRYSWKVRRGRGGKGAAAGSEEARKIVLANQRLAAGWMNQARTLPELSRRMGALPDECREGPDAERICVWHTSGHTLGHGTLAVWIDADKTKKITLRCVLPADGGSREPESCRARVGGRPLAR